MWHWWWTLGRRRPAMVTAVRICFPLAPVGEWQSWAIGAQRWQAALTVCVCVCVAPQGMTSIASFAGHCKVVHVPDVLIDSGFETARGMSAEHTLPPGLTSEARLRMRTQHGM